MRPVSDVSDIIISLAPLLSISKVRCVMTWRCIYLSILFSVYLVCAVGVLSSAAPDHSQVTDLRDVDFLNFTYSTPSEIRCEVVGKLRGGLCLQNTIRVEDGVGVEGIDGLAIYVEHPALGPAQVGSKQVSYGDLTGDGIEETMVPFRVDLKDETSHYFVVFGLEGGKPRLLQWLGPYNNDEVQLKAVRIDDGRIRIIGVRTDPESKLSSYCYELVWKWDATTKTFEPSPHIRPTDLCAKPTA
jgi:hypothetical protein